jgi:hypothetical protein
MKNLGQYIDQELSTEYTLYYGKLSEVKSYISNAYNNINPEDFIREKATDYMIKDNSAKINGLYYNNFLVTQNLFSDKPYLLDGFTRLFMAYEELKDKDVFVKDYPNLSDDKTMKLMGLVNFWKTTESFIPLIDRGFCLYTYMKTGYNIINHVNEDLIGYFDLKSPLFYLYNWRQIKIDANLMFNNPKVFDDIIAICKLYDLKAECGKQFAAQFYLIVRRLRTKYPEQEIKVDELSDWLLKDKRMNELALALSKSYNVTSKETIMEEATQYVWRKFIMPNWLGEEPQKTKQEEKKEFQAMATKTKKQYKKITYKDLMSLPLETVFYTIEQDISNFRFEITPKKYFGYEISKFNVKGIMGSDKGKIIRVEDMFDFKIETDGKINVVSIVSDYYLKNDAGYIKIENEQKLKKSKS